ncbi:MAG: hypothetical protein A2008_12995 [Candidatus Wallbacteria bacterium GWC2_49_35]|uniref:CYTH domain-containing protein n=1 Tax=Candidatus Wallbacteria bacterium GWC2_49_35 TaxID=1817813 RepID=A0A1F7WF51_9BACT|nr:MAG: hypothetical protein A2008_12995 [Candidatus Wallbacteria bacterium GWC2_49_35]HBC75728.1 hypothetical protein [Candidatus Wallbacteria bacterium]
MNNKNKITSRFKLHESHTGKVVLVFAAIFVLTLALSPAFAGGDTVLNSRECKVLLLAGRFTDCQPAARDFWALSEKAARACGIETAVQHGDIEEERCAVWFIDTEQFVLYKTGLVLRRRKEGGRFNYTFKYRDLDMAAAAAKNVSPASEFKGKTSFEEDVVVKPDKFERIFSKSGKADLKKDVPMTADSLVKIFPGMASFMSKKRTELAVVNGVKIDELTFDYGTIFLTPVIKAKASFTVWYLAGEKTPVIAEFSYKYKYDGAGSESELAMVHHASDKFLAALRAEIKPWLAAGQTKTGFVYKFTSGNNE